MDAPAAWPPTLPSGRLELVGQADVAAPAHQVVGHGVGVAVGVARQIRRLFVEDVVDADGDDRLVEQPVGELSVVVEDVGRLVAKRRRRSLS